MNAKGRVKEAVSSLAWHESYEHSHEHPDIIDRMREHTEKAVEDLEAAKHASFLQSWELKRDATHEADAARVEHQKAMKAYENDVSAEITDYEQRNERKIEERIERDVARGVDPDREPESRTGVAHANVAKRGTLSFAGAENNRHLQATDEAQQP